jgi:membrane protein
MEAAGRIGKALWLAGELLFRDNGPYWASALAYFALLSSFPLILAAATIVSFFVETEQAVDYATSLVGDFLPEGEDMIEAVISEAIDARGRAGLVSLGLLLWSGSRVFGAVTRALNVAFGAHEHYPLHKRLLIELAMLFTIGILFVLAFASRWILNAGWGLPAFLPESGLVYGAVRGAVPGFLLFLALALTYRFVPRRDVHWRPALAGAAVGALLFVVAQPLFLGYLGQIGELNVIYGSVTAIVILVIWAWIVSLIVLYGGNVAARFQSMLIEGKSAEEVRQTQRGTPKGD